METRDEVVEIEGLEKQLIPSQQQEDVDETPVLYTASFSEMEENFINYQTAKWVLYSLLLLLAWGFGLLMLLYLPLRRFILRKDLRSRKLYLTPNAIVYKVTRPVLFPCFGVLKKEKYVLLPSVADIVIEQGYLQSSFKVYSVRIESAGIRRPPSDDVQIQGVANPSAFRKAVLTHLDTMKTEAFTKKLSAIEDVSVRAGCPQTSRASPSRSFRHDALPPNELILLQKLEEVNTSIKRVQTLIEEQQSEFSSRTCT